MTPRVAIVQLTSSPGGSQNLWVHAFTDPRFAAVEKHVVLPAGGVTRLSAADRASAQITMHEFGSRAGLIARRVLRPFSIPVDPITRALDRVRPDLVWFNLAGLGELGWIGAATRSCRARGIPYWLIVQHVHEHFLFLGDAFTDAARETARQARRVLVVSERNRRALAVAFGEELPNVERVVNGVTREFLDAGARIAGATPPRANGTAHFLSPARFDPAFKGQHLLLEAFASDAWRTRDWRLTLLGGGDHAALLGRLVSWFGLPAQRVTIAPHTTDMPGAFGGADVIVMPSLSEGSPFALVEGMACGRPAVGTPVGGIDEYVREGESGWLARSTEPGDIADALERCWRDRALWVERGQAARAIIAATCDLDRAHPALLSHALADARVRR
jgi:glycosyltransferase involved in cell wall biosynthesis